MAATFNKFRDFVEQLGLEQHNLSADTLKVFLSNEQPLVTDTIKTDIAECADIANETNHGAGGGDIQNTWSEATGTATLAGTDVVFEASGGTVGPFQFVVLYNDTNGTDMLIGWWDYGSAITLQDGETFTTDFGASILTVA
jgi:hypothetical protein